MIKKKYIILTYTLIIILFFLFFIFYFGNKYLKRLNTFIVESNKIIIKNELNSFINNLSDINYSDIYEFKYNNEKEIIGASYDNKTINKYLITYINKFKRKMKNNLYNEYFKKEIINNNTYLLVPIGITSDNPFIYNFGPNIFLSYDYINTYNFHLDFDAKTYGLNNTMVNIYLVVNIDISIFKPVLKTVNSYEYKFLLSSQLVYGRVAPFLGTGFNMQSDNL